MGKKKGKKKAAPSEEAKSAPKEELKEAEVAPDLQGAVAASQEQITEAEVVQTPVDPEVVGLVESLGAMALDPNEDQPMDIQSSGKSKRQRKKRKGQRETSAEPGQSIVGLTFVEDQRKEAVSSKKIPRQEVAPPGLTEQAPVSFIELPPGRQQPMPGAPPGRQQPMPRAPPGRQQPMPRAPPGRKQQPMPGVPPGMQQPLPGTSSGMQQQQPMPGAPSGRQQQPMPGAPLARQQQPMPGAPPARQQQPMPGAPPARQQQPMPGAPPAKQQQSMPGAPPARQQQPIPGASPVRQQQPMPGAPPARQQQPMPGAPPARQQQAMPGAPPGRQQQPIPGAPPGSQQQPMPGAAPGRQQQPMPRAAPGKQPSEAGPSFQKPVQPHPSGAAGEPHYQKQSQLARVYPEGMRPPERKGYGSLGNKIKLTVNHFEVKFPVDRVIYHYDVDFKPDLKSQKVLKRKIIHQMLETNREFFGKCVFDGEKNLYSIHDLKIGTSEVINTVNLTEEGARGKNEFQVHIKQVAEVPLILLKQFLDKKIRDLPQTQIQSLDIVLRHLPSMRFTTVGRSIFPLPDDFVDLGRGVAMWRGFYLSLRPGEEWKPLQLNLDISNRTFYKAQPVLDFVCEYFEIYFKDLKTFKVGNWQEFAREIRRIKVEVTHTLPMKRKYNIIDVTPGSAAETKFPMKQDDGTEVWTSVADYFRTNYKINLSYPHLPCLQASPKEKHRYLPMEVCVIVPGQQCKKLSDIQTANMIRKSAVPAPERKAKIEQLIREANFNQDPYVKEFGLSVSSSLMSLEGRVLPPPGIELAGQKRITPKQGVWDIRNSKLHEGKNLDYWALVNFDYRFDCSIFVEEFKKIGRTIGIIVQEPGFYTKADSRKVNAVLMMYQDIKSKVPGLQLIVNILPGKDKIYAEIKRVGDTVIGIATQCIQSRNLRRISPPTIVNIFLKINAKLGGTNNKVLTDITTQEIFKTPVIFFGADVTHPPAGDKSKPSIAAVVASMDMFASIYSAKVCVQEHRVEIIQDLKTCVRELLIEFKRRLTAEPKRIIFYRDGVGEGQFAEVLIHELTAIREACSSLSQTYQPRITFLVVQKRHHTRLFCENSRDAIGKSQNIPPGTTVDHTITHPIENDFYLCSHQGIQGTSRPTHYHILWDDSNLSSDQLQMVTYQLCHTYVRCNRSVSIPAPAYYAHLVAFRARHHLENEQKKVDEGKIAYETSIKNMKKAVLIHSDLQKMYFV